MFTIKKMIVVTICVFLFNVVCDNKKNPINSNNNTNNHNYNNTNDTLNKDSSCTTVLVYGTVTDADGNVYKTVKIGNQVWTTEDLRTTKFKDSTAIPNVTETATWMILITPAYCFYNNSTDLEKNKKYGALYNWYAVNSNKLAPIGWHVPTISDWDILRDYLISHGYSFADSTTDNTIAKSLAAKTDWRQSSISGTVGNDLDKNNKSGFNALPNGSRYANQGSDFGNMGLHTHYWCSNESYRSAYSIYISYDSSTISTHIHFKFEGFAVRLVKDP